MNILHRRRSQRQQSYPKRLKVKMEGADGAILVFHGWLAWALLCLIEAGEVGVAPLDQPAPRWSHYVSKFRQKGIEIETVLELHGGPYPGRRGRYVLRCAIEIINREGAE
jgi:hypothetical protein